MFRSEKEMEFSSPLSLSLSFPSSSLWALEVIAVVIHHHHRGILASVDQVAYFPFLLRQSEFRCQKQ